MEASSPCSFRTGRSAALALVNRGAVDEKVEMGWGKRLGIQTHRIFFEEKNVVGFLVAVYTLAPRPNFVSA
jgi:hypothetical protein